MRAYEQTKREHEEFMRTLISKYEVIAPVMTDAARFQPIKDPSQIWLKTQTYEPAKQWFYPSHQTLFQFDGMKMTTVLPKHPKRVFYGLRRCDLNAIRKQDMVLLQDAHDPHYAKMRENTWLLGYHCNSAPSEHCFCASLKMHDHQDIMFYDKEDHYLVEIGSDKGLEMIEAFKEYFQEATRHITQEDKIIKGADKLKRTEIKTLYDNPEWKKGVDLCVSCGACTTLCPTCYCFSIEDEVTAADPSKGTRNRVWSSCQLPEFTKVAGGHVFRAEREQRFKHRIYHQLQYFKEKYGEDLCVGCGRCITACPTRIDWVQMLNEMQE